MLGRLTHTYLYSNSFQLTRIPSLILIALQSLYQRGIIILRHTPLVRQEMKVVGKGIDTLTAYRIFADYSVKINALGFLALASYYVGERVDLLGVLPRTKRSRNNRC